MSTISEQLPRMNTTPNAASQGSSTTSNASMNEDGVTVRSMRLKVLYTFDDQNKTNHLARWPEIISIQTVTVEETNIIGVVELQTCIRAIIQNSPELVARIGQDYTVYAFDYSEYDNPLVGQGMFSQALAAASSSLDAPSSQNGQLVTGRVCKNIMGLFSNGIKETLEVKLRLVPVPTVLNNEYLEAMNRCKDINRIMPSNVDMNEWSAFMANQSFGQTSNRPSPVPVQTPNQRDGTSMEVFNQLLHPQKQQQHQQQQSQMNTFDLNMNAEASGNESRGDTTAVGKGKKTSRSSSRASVKRPRGRKPKAAAAGGNTSGYEEGTDGDDGPALRKRAKVQKADYTNNSAFTTGADSLHKAATTSGPLRVLRPLAMSPHPQNSALSNTQDIPRVPTPVPNKPILGRANSQGASNPRRESFLAQSQSTDELKPRIAPYSLLDKSEDQLRYSIESAGPSPEKIPSPADTLPTIGSSPPIMRTRPPSRMRSSPPCPSSPDLPQMPRTDSGFMSGSLDDLFGENEVVQNIGDDDDDVDMVAEHEGRCPAMSGKCPVEKNQNDITIEADEAADQVDLPPHRASISREAESRIGRTHSRAGSAASDDGPTLPPLKKTNRPPTRPVSRSKEMDQVPSASGPQNSSLPPNTSQQAGPPIPDVQQTSTLPPPPAPRTGSRMVRTASMGSLTFPTILASDPVLPPSSLQRCQTWSEAPHPASEAPISLVHTATYNGPCPPVNYGQPEPVYSRLADPKKVQIKQRLEMAIANGQMPPFCANCGAIQTPTWRKAWSQEFQGEPGYYEYSDQPGCVTAINILMRDEEGKPVSYQIIKKFLAQSENQDDFKEFLLCNQRWESNGTFAERGSKGEAKKRPQQRPSKAKKQANTSMAFLTSEANFPASEAYFPPSDTNLPYSESYHSQKERAGPTDGISPTDTTCMSQFDGVPGQNPQQRKDSIRNGKRLNAMTSDAASAALRRAIQSSPARWVGSQQCPVDVEEDLGSTRRLLFPSPRKDGSPIVLGEVTTNVVTIATDFCFPKRATTEMVNKENCPPTIDAEDPDAELLKLFEEELARPSTPTGKSPPNNPFKTPTRPTPSHRPVTRSVTRSIRSVKSPGQLFLFNRTPSRTPGSRRLQRHLDVFESPFTATLNQLMSEANNQPSPSRSGNGIELDYGNLPPLPNPGNNDSMDMNFNLEDYFSTDVPMPSSPPRLNFSLYEDPLTMQHMEEINWDSFGRLEPKHLHEGGGKIQVKEEAEDPTGKEIGDAPRI